MFLIDKLGDWLFDEFLKPRLPGLAAWVGRHKRRVLVGLTSACALVTIVLNAYPIVALYRGAATSPAQIASRRLFARASSNSIEAMIPTGPTTETITYGPGNLIDGNLQTAWQVDNDGIKQSVEIGWDRPLRFHGLRIVPGYLKETSDKWGDRWTLNNRVKQVRVDAYINVLHLFRWKVWSETKTLADEKIFQSINAPHWVPATSVTLTILDVYPSQRTSPVSGRPIHDTCVSEVEVFETL